VTHKIRKVSELDTVSIDRSTGWEYKHKNIPLLAQFPFSDLPYLFVPVSF
jgi:hypothetical protein